MHYIGILTNSVTMPMCVVFCANLENFSLTCTDMRLHSLTSYVLLLV